MGGRLETFSSYFAAGGDPEHSRRKAPIILIHPLLDKMVVSTIVVMRHVRCSHDAHRLRCGPEPEERYFRSETLRNKGSGLTEPRAEWQPPVMLNGICLRSTPR